MISAYRTCGDAILQKHNSYDFYALLVYVYETTENADTKNRCITVEEQKLLFFEILLTIQKVLKISAVTKCLKLKL
jgi:hypothetical protein